MQLPLFFLDDQQFSANTLTLPEETSKYIVTVLRMKKGARLNLTDGSGKFIEAEILDDHKKHCIVKIVASSEVRPSERKIIVAVSLLKNSARFEWMLEKLTEIGIDQIVPFISEHTERQKFKKDRFKNILVSAMLQSQQCWLPDLMDPVSFKELFSLPEISGASQKFVAHCIETEKRMLADLVNESLPSQVILIGPEGDFAAEEVQLALRHHFDAVSLGNNRLRAETAAVAASVLMRIR